MNLKTRLTSTTPPDASGGATVSTTGARVGGGSL